MQVEARCSSTHGVGRSCAVARASCSLLPGRARAAPPRDRGSPFLLAQVALRRRAGARATAVTDNLVRRRCSSSSFLNVSAAMHADGPALLARPADHRSPAARSARCVDDYDGRRRRRCLWIAASSSAALTAAVGRLLATARACSARCARRPRALERERGRARRAGGARRARADRRRPARHHRPRAERHGRPGLGGAAAAPTRPRPRARRVRRRRGQRPRRARRAAPAARRAAPRGRGARARARRRASRTSSRSSRRVARGRACRSSCASRASPSTLPAGVDVTAYRVVQEALGAALEHGGAGRARRRRPLRRRRRSSSRCATTGRRDGDDARRLLGMRERVALVRRRAADAAARATAATPSARGCRWRRRREPPARAARTARRTRCSPRAVCVVGLHRAASTRRGRRAARVALRRRRLIACRSRFRRRSPLPALAVAYAVVLDRRRSSSRRDFDDFTIAVPRAADRRVHRRAGSPRAARRAHRPGDGLRRSSSIDLRGQRPARHRRPHLPRRLRAVRLGGRPRASATARCSPPSCTRPPLRAEEQHEEAAARAVAEERRRIAREMHDLVGHSVSVMVVQAGGARRILDRDPDRAIEAAVRIEQTGRAALAEMRRLLGLLGPHEADQLRARSRRSTALGALVERARDAGLPVDAARRRRAARAARRRRARRVPRRPGGADQRAQARRRARRPTCSLRWDPDALEIVVADRGPARAAPPRELPSGGHGLVGMRERVRVYGGELTARPAARRRLRRPRADPAAPGRGAGGMRRPPRNDVLLALVVLARRARRAGGRRIGCGWGVDAR